MDFDRYSMTFTILFFAVLLSYGPLIPTATSSSNNNNALKTNSNHNNNEDKGGVMLPTKCEVCRLIALELEAEMAEAGRTHSTLETAKGKVKKYVDSDLFLIEALELLCDRFKQYSIHKERKGISRFARGESATMKTLHGLVDRGVKVELGIPYELWDSPSVETAELKSQCEWIVSEYEDVIEQWFEKRNKEDQIPLQVYLPVLSVSLLFCVYFDKRMFEFRENGAPKTLANRYRPSASRGRSALHHPCLQPPSIIRQTPTASFAQTLE